MRLIDADALIPMMKYATIDNEIGVFPIKIGFNDVKKVIDEQPTIEERKTGEWIPDPDRDGYGRYICSVCESPFEVEEVMGKPLWKFCPMCGARMEAQNE